MPFFLTEQINADKQFSANSIIESRLSDKVIFNGGVNFKKLSSHNYVTVTDLLGGDFALNVDSFYSGDAAQLDLNNPDARILKGGTIGYNYKLFATTMDAFAQVKVSTKKVDFYLAQTVAQTEYQREGLFKNGIYASNSFGKSTKKDFTNFGSKGGFTYKINGRNYIDFNSMYLNRAPNLRNSFPNARKANDYTANLESETIIGGDLSYILRTPKLKARLTGFANQIKDATELSFFYAENIGDSDGDEDSFITEIVTGIEKQNIGAELGIEYQLTSTIKAIAAASYGQYIFSDNAKLQTSDDGAASNGLNPYKDFGTVYLKDYKQAGTPQTAASFGLEYRDPKFWWIGANLNYLTDSYIDVSSILRTDNFTLDNYGDNFTGVTNESVRKILKQEKFDDIMLLNLTGGKSWMVNSKTRSTVGFFASINNVLDLEYKTGGFEQSRKATYPDLSGDNANNTPSFGPKYFYGYGRTFFVNFYINF